MAKNKCPSIFYGEKPITEVDFRTEFQKELDSLKSKISDIEKKQEIKGDSFNYQYWTIKLHATNERLQQEKVTLD